MKKFLSSRSKLLCLSVTVFFVAIAGLIAFFDSEPVIAFLAVMILSMAVLLPLYLVMFVQIFRAKKLMKRQEEETGDLLSSLNDSDMKQINSHIALNGKWIVNNALNRQCLLHKDSIVSIYERDAGLEINTSLRNKPYLFVLTEGESSDFEKKCILHWYDPLYEIPLEEYETDFKQTNRKNLAWIAAAAAIVSALCIIVSQINVSVFPETGFQEDEYIYFYDYLTDTSKGTLDDISYDIVKLKDECLMYIYNDGEVYADLEINLYDAEDTLVDTVWSDVIRPGYYTSVYIDEEPASIRVTSSWFYEFDYHLPAFEYELEYARKDYFTWVNVLLDSSLMTLENVRHLGIREYAIEELTYTGADCVYVYDKAAAQRTIDKITGAETWDISSAQYRIDYELYDYKIHIYELDGTKETLVETVTITKE